ncbi:MAG: type II secretion system F family protein [bacterium]|jgi:tight adherence protein C
MVYLICMTGALFVFVLVQLLVSLWGRDRRRVLARLDSLRTPVPAELESELKAPFSQRVVLPGLQLAGSFLTRLTPGGMQEGIRRKLILAGSPGKLGPNEFLGLQGLAGLAGLVLGIILARLVAGQVPLWGMAGLAGGLLLPHLYLGQTLEGRQKKVRRSLPDVLDLLTISVEAGLGFDAAVLRVTEKLGGVLGEEFSRVLQETKMGKSRREALRGMAARVGVDDVSSFVNAVIQAEQLGVSIGSVLRLQSQAMRVKRRQRAEEAALQAPVKMLFPLIFFIFPGLFVVLLGPAVIQIMETLLGM